MTDDPIAELKASRDAAALRASIATSNATAAKAAKELAAAMAPLAGADPVAERKARAEADQAVAIAQKAMSEASVSTSTGEATALRALIPTPVTKPVAGDIRVDSTAGSAGRGVAYGLLHTAAQRLVLALRLEAALYLTKPTLVIEDRDLAASDWAHALVNSQTAALQGRTTDLIARLQDRNSAAPAGRQGGEAQSERIAPLLAAGLALQAIPAAIGSIADIAGYFKSAYSLIGQSITGGSTPFVAEFVRALRERDTGCAAVTLDRFRLVPAADGGTISRFRDLESSGRSSPKCAVQWRKAVKRRTRRRSIRRRPR